jgi:hypothetical protein
MTAPHRIHAAPASGAGGCSVDIGASRWRADGGKDREEKRAHARRIAVCWNVLEGWPTEALEDGVLRLVDDAARALLAAADCVDTDKIDPADARALTAACDAMRAAFATRDPKQDTTHGRLHDCPACMTKGVP